MENSSRKNPWTYGYILQCIVRSCVHAASKSRDEDGQVRGDVSRSCSPQQVDVKSSPSVTSSPSLSPSSSSSSSRSAAYDQQPSRPPQQAPTGNDVIGATMTSPPGAAVLGAAEETQQGGGSAGGTLVRRRAVDLSDLRSCALVQTQMKTRNASTSWRYDALT